MMPEVARWCASELALFALIAMGTHLVVSGSQTLFHYSLGHHRLGGAFFRNHIRFHHTYMPEAIWCPPRIAVTKETIPHTFSSPSSWLLRSCSLFSPLLFFSSWPQRAQAHFTHTSILTRHITCKNRNSRALPGSGASSSFIFVHHLHANSNFAVIDFFWDRLLGTYREPDGDAR